MYKYIFGCFSVCVSWATGMSKIIKWHAVVQISGVEHHQHLLYISCSGWANLKGALVSFLVSCQGMQEGHFDLDIKTTRGKHRGQLYGTMFRLMWGWVPFFHLNWACGQQPISSPPNMITFHLLNMRKRTKYVVSSPANLRCCVWYSLGVMLHLPHRDISFCFWRSLYDRYSLYCLLYREIVRTLWCKDILTGIVFAANPVPPHCVPCTRVSVLNLEANCMLFK